MEVPQINKNRITLQPSNFTTGYLPKGHKNADLKEHVSHNVYNSAINNSQIMEGAQMSIK